MVGRIEPTLSDGLKEFMAEPVVVFEFTTVTGKKLRRSFKIDEAPDEPPIPAWLANVRKVWDTPQDPIVYTGNVLKGSEAAARRWLRELKPQGGNHGSDAKTV